MNASIRCSPLPFRDDYLNLQNKFHANRSVKLYIWISQTFFGIRSNLVRLHNWQNGAQAEKAQSSVCVLSPTDQPANMTITMHLSIYNMCHYRQLFAKNCVRFVAIKKWVCFFRFYFLVIANSLQLSSHRNEIDQSTADHRKTVSFFCHLNRSLQTTRNVHSIAI